MDDADAKRQVLLVRDVAGFRALGKRLFGHLGGQPTNNRDAEISMHMAITLREDLPFAHRAYSHAWLVERSYPSQLPDALKPMAQRIHPVVVEAVGIAIKVSSPERRPLALAVRGAMETVVQEMFADGDRDPILVKKQMFAARRRVLMGA